MHPKVYYIHDLTKKNNNKKKDKGGCYYGTGTYFGEIFSTKLIVILEHIFAYPENCSFFRTISYQKIDHSMIENLRQEFSVDGSFFHPKYQKKFHCAPTLHV
jgi:hypothetical protein